MYGDELDNLSSKLTKIGDFTKSPLIGLKEVKECPYINSVLYCLSNFRSFADYFLDPLKSAVIKKNLSTDKNEPSISMALRYTINNLWRGKENTSFSPDKIIDVLSKNDSFKIIYDSKGLYDSTDILKEIIKKINEELIGKETEKKFRNFMEDKLMTMTSLNIKTLDKTNKIKAFKKFQLNLIKNSLTIGNYYFNTIIEVIEKKMVNEKSVTEYIYSSESIIEFDIRNVASYKREVDPNDLTEISLKDCFAHYQREKKTEAKSKFVNIYSLPPVMIIGIKSGKIKVDQYLNIFELFPNIGDEFKTDFKKMEIMSFIKKSGSGSDVHYKGFTIVKPEKSWYSFDDETIQKLDTIQNEINSEDEFTTLFYKIS